MTQMNQMIQMTYLDDPNDLDDPNELDDGDCRCLKEPQSGFRSIKMNKLGMFWNPQDLLLMMGTEIFKIDVSNHEKPECHF